MKPPFNQLTLTHSLILFYPILSYLSILLPLPTYPILTARLPKENTPHTEYKPTIKRLNPNIYPLPIAPAADAARSSHFSPRVTHTHVRISQ